MSITLQQSDGKLFACVSGEFGKVRDADISSLLVLGDDLGRFINPILDGMRLKLPQTAINELTKLHALGEAFAHLHISGLPHYESEWQKLVLDVHRFVITRTDRKSSLKTRCASDWQIMRSFFADLMENGVTPLSVYLPPVRESLEAIDISRYHGTLLGQTAPVVAVTAVDKLLCSVSLARTDAEYLEEIRDTLTSRRHVLKEALTDYWMKLKANMIFGRKLIESVDWAELEPRVKSSPIGISSVHPANPNHGIIGLANYLTVIRYKYGGHPISDDDMRKKVIRNSQFIPRSATIGPVSSWLTKIDAPSNFLDRKGISERHILWWWQGRISHFDTAIITSLLIMLHPSWTPSSVMLSKITDRNGKKYLDLSEDGYSYEVEKPRAKMMKQESLDPIAYDIISTLIDMNSDIRQELNSAGDPRGVLLFLPYGNERISMPNPSGASGYLSGSKHAKKDTANRRYEDVPWIGMLYPELITAGLSKGTISIKKIRNTEGVLEWFRTKSLRAVSRKLGNTQRVVLQHYIPKALMDAWNTRMIRRFQNLWISVAAANEDWLLDVTDFVSLADLHAFLTDMLKLHSPSDSPLAEIFHHRFGTERAGNDIYKLTNQLDIDGHLHVAISKASLSALYSYQAAVLELGLQETELDKPDIVTGLSPRHFLALTDLLQLRLPEDKNPVYVNCHEDAMRIAAAPGNREKWMMVLRS